MNQGNATSIGWCDENGVTHYHDDPDRSTWRQYSIVGHGGERIGIVALPPSDDQLDIASSLGAHLKEIAT